MNVSPTLLVQEDERELEESIWKYRNQDTWHRDPYLKQGRKAGTDT